MTQPFEKYLQDVGDGDVWGGIHRVLHLHFYTTQALQRAGQEMGSDEELFRLTAQEMRRLCPLRHLLLANEVRQTLAPFKEQILDYIKKFRSDRGSNFGDYRSCLGSSGVYWLTDLWLAPEKDKQPFLAVGAELAQKGILSGTKESVRISKNLFLSLHPWSWMFARCYMEPSSTTYQTFLTQGIELGIKGKETFTQVPVSATPLPDLLGKTLGLDEETGFCALQVPVLDLPATREGFEKIEGSNPHPHYFVDPVKRVVELDIVMKFNLGELGYEDILEGFGVEGWLEHLSSQVKYKKPW